MSWSEVKKINSDLSVPLDKRIETIQDGFLMGYKTMLHSSSFCNSSGSFDDSDLIDDKYKILDINGEGLLLYIFSNTKMPTYSNIFARIAIKVISDDNTAIDIRVHRVFLGNTYREPYSLIDIHKGLFLGDKIPYFTRAFSSGEDKDLPIYDNNYEDKEIRYVIDDGVKFKKNLKIYIKNSNSLDMNINFEIGYALSNKEK